MSSIVEWISQNTVLIIEVLIGVGVIIFVHELGHFIFAKKIGARVDVFSLGFGPRLVGFKRGETDYRLSLIPLGGYVKIFGQGGVGETEEKADPRFFENKTVGQRFWVFVAGVLMNFLIAFPICIFVALVGRGVPRNIVADVAPASPAFNAGIKEGDTLLSVVPSAAATADALTEEDWRDGEIDNWESFTKMLLYRGNDKGLWLKVKREGVEKELVIHIPAKDIYAADIRARISNTGMFAGETVTAVDKVLEGSPATGILREGDVIVGVDGRKIDKNLSLFTLLDESLVQETPFLRYGVESKPGMTAKPVRLTVRRKGDDGQYQDVVLPEIIPSVKIFYDLGLVLMNRPTVGAIRSGSVAEKAGLHIGDTITRMGAAGQAMKDVVCWQDVEEAFGEFRGKGGTLVAKVRRGQDEFTFELNPESGENVKESLGMYFQAGLHIRRFLVDSPLGPRSDLFDGITNVYELPSAADPSQGNWGDEILQVDDVVFEKRLATPEDFRMAMANSYGGEKGMPRLILVKFRKPDGTEKSVGIANPLLSYRAILGIQLTETYGGSLLKYDAGRAIGIGLKEPFETVGLTAYSVYMMFTGEAKTNELAGPVGIFQLAMRTAKMGPASLLKFLAFLTVSLAILNILPIPVLDGGHILFLGIEKVRGRPISEKMRARLEMVGLVLILMLVVFALRNDIYRGTGMI